MPTILKPRGRGRPPTHPVDRLRTRLWINVLKQLSGLPSAYAIEMALDGDRVRKRQRDVARPRKWDAYGKGDKVPEDVPKPRNAIDQAEARWSGAARWFRSPIWRYLKKERFEARHFEDALQTLDPEVVSVLFEPEPREHESTPRQRAFDDDSVRQLISIASFDALVAAILLVGLSEAIASPELRERALNVYVELQAPLRQLPELAGIYPDLYSLIDSACKHWIYVSSNQRLEAVIFWQGVQAHMEKEQQEGK
jgi:hypothetical protein